MFVWWLLLIALFLPQSPCDFFQGHMPHNYISSDDNLEENELINALDSVLNFFYADKDNVNLDGFMGTVVAEAQLNLILKNIGQNHSLYTKISNLQKKSHNLHKLLKKSVRFKTSISKKIYSHLLRSKIWEINRIFLNKSLSNFPPYNWTNIPHKKVMRLFYKGQPSGEQSDRCIGEIIDSLLPHTDEHDCIPSLGCHKIMSQLYTSHGYPLTHKLLYIQVSRGLKCKLDENVMMDSINFLCSRILREFRAIENYHHKNPTFQDLYFEQMVLCGMEGFTEFLTETSRKNLLKWQSTYGCYGNREFHSPKDRGRPKRNTHKMKYGCESHVSGLGAAALAVNLNFLVLYSMTDSAEEFSNILMLI